MKKTIIITLLIFIFISLKENTLANKPSSINCHAIINLMALNKNISSKVSFTMVLSNDNGWIKISGYANDNGYKTIINRKIFFDYIRVNNYLNIITKQLIIYNDDYVDNSTLERLFPLPYIYPNLKMDMSIYPQNEGGYLLSSTGLHDAYCF